MHVIYDARVVAYHYTGLGRFAGELLIALLDMGLEDGIRYTVILMDEADEDTANPYYQKFKNYQAKDICRIVTVACPAISLRHHYCLPRVVNQLSGDIYIYPHFDLPFGIRIPSVAVIHDLFPLKVDGYVVKKPWLKVAYFKLMLRVVARKAKLIFAVSETTKRDFLSEVGKRFLGKVDVSLEGPIVRALQGKQTLCFPLLSMPDRFVLYVGDRRPHKNIKRIIDLFILLKETASYQGYLLLAGSTKNYDFDVDGYIGKRTDIIIVGQIEDQALVLLYQRMDALIFLSKYEGFGLPVVEAALFGKKIIASDGGSLPEVAPPWAFILPNDADLKRFVLQIKVYLDDPIVIDRSYGEQYAWNSVAQKVRSRFIELLN